LPIRNLADNEVAPMRMTERQINALVGTALLALAPIAWLQYRWISEVSEADQQRRTIELKAALERIAAETDRDAGKLHATLIGPPGGDDDALEKRIEDYQAPEDAVPLLKVLRLREMKESWTAERWDENQKRMVPAMVPAWWAGRPYRRGPIHAEPAALLGLAPGAESAEEGLIVLELDERRVLEEYLPRVIRAHLGADFEKEYAIRVTGISARDTGEVSTTVFRRIVRGSPPGRRGPPAWKKKGGPPGMEAAGDGIWRVEARYQDGSLEAVVSRTRVRNLVLSGITLLFLGAALLAVGYALRRSQRLARLQLEFTAGVSHELRTPLAVIVSAGDNLAGGYVTDPAKVREYGALVREEGTRLTGMVDQVLRFSEFESERVPLEKRALLLADIVEQVEREMRPIAERQGCVWDASYENAVLTGDASALHVAIRNLVENGLRHGGGKWIGLRARKVGNSVEITVEDRGAGILPADLPHLFEPFYRGVVSRAEQRKGSGLGLALVDRIARGHGGTARVENKTDGGARFTLTITCE